MFPVGLALQGAGIVGGILSHSGSGDYGAHGYEGLQNQYLNKLGALGSQYQQFGDQAMGSFNNYDPQYRSSVDNYANYLREDPYTDQRDAADLARATAGTTAAYTAARARLASSLQQRGLDTASSASPSSAYAGGMAGIENNYAGTIANAQNQLAYNRINQRQSNMQGLMGLLGGVANNYYDRGMNNYGAQGNIDTGLASSYGSLAQEAYTRQQADQKALWGDVAAAGDWGGSLDKYLKTAWLKPHKPSDPIVTSGFTSDQPVSTTG